MEAEPPPMPVFSAMAGALRTPSTFDLAHINDQWGSPVDDIYRTILGIFAEEGVKLCADARASLATGRRDVLARAAHTLAGASANVGALHLAACARSLQASAETGKNSELEPLVARVEAAWHAVRDGIAQGEPLAHG
jgi:HPt (histidine-containing phosphotransfer) domain-containing protein